MSHLEHPPYTKSTLDFSVTGKAKWSARKHYSLLAAIQTGNKWEQIVTHFCMFQQDEFPKDEEKGETDSEKKK